MLSKSLILSTVIATLAATTAGLAFGYSSSAIFQLFLSTESSAVFASCLNIGGLVGSLLSGYLLSNYGRRWTIFCACIPGLIGWTWLRTSANTVYERYGPTVLFISGRLLTGVSAGIIIPASAAYLVEIAPPHLYNIFGMLTQMGIVTGILLGYIFGSVMAWEQVAVLNALIMLLTLLLMAVLPESPKWLMKVGRTQQANAVYTELRGSIPLSVDAESLKPSEDDTPEPIRARARDYFLPCLAVPSNQQRRLRVAVVLMILQQLTGVNAILYFAESVCLFGGMSAPSTCAVWLGGSQVVFTLMAIFIINRYSRRRLLQFSALIMLVSHFVHGAIVTFAIPLGMFLFITKFCLVTFLLGFSIGWGPLPVLVIMDMFPVSTRGFACATAVAFNWATSFAVTLTFEICTVTLGSGFLFWVFASFCLFCYVFATRYVPEKITSESH